VSVNVTVEVLALEALRYMDAIPAKVERAAYRALNRGAAKARTLASKAIREEVNFQAKYLGPANKRLTVSRKARSGSLEAEIKGRGRPTSLANFIKGSRKPVKRGDTRGLSVNVKKGAGATFIGGAFLINLNNGNVGLAVRTAGGKPRGAYRPKPIGKDGRLWLLYGPSVDQVLHSVSSGTGIFRDISPEVARVIEAEYLRLLKLDIP